MQSLKTLLYDSSTYTHRRDSTAARRQTNINVLIERYVVSNDIRGYRLLQICTTCRIWPSDMGIGDGPSRVRLREKEVFAPDPTSTEGRSSKR